MSGTSADTSGGTSGCTSADTSGCTSGGTSADTSSSTSGMPVGSGRYCLLYVVTTSVRRGGMWGSWAGDSVCSAGR